MSIAVRRDLFGRIVGFPLDDRGVALDRVLRFGDLWSSAEKMLAEPHECSQPHELGTQCPEPETRPPIWRPPR